MTPTTVNEQIPTPPELATEAIRSHIRKETIIEEPFLSLTGVWMARK